MRVALAFQGPISSWGQQSALCCIVLVLPLILQAVEGGVKILCSYSDFSSAVKRPSLAALLQRPLFPVNGLLEGGRSASETQRSGQQVLLGLSGRSGTGQGRRKSPTVAVSEAVKFSPSGWPPSQQRDQICGWTVIKKKAEYEVRELGRVTTDCVFLSNPHKNNNKKNLRATFALPKMSQSGGISLYYSAGSPCGSSHKGQLHLSASTRRCLPPPPPAHHTYGGAVKHAHKKTSSWQRRGRTGDRRRMDKLKTGTGGETGRDSASRARGACFSSGGNNSIHWVLASCLSEKQNQRWRREMGDAGKEG